MTSAPLRLLHVGLESILDAQHLLLCLGHSVDPDRRELTATLIMHLAQRLISDDQHLLLCLWHSVDTDGREEGRVSLAVFGYGWKTVYIYSNYAYKTRVDGREFTSTPIMHLGQGSMVES